jgi:hypothetical protein
MPEQGEPAEIELPKQKPYRMKFKIETPRGVYEVLRPVGRFGSIHFALLSRCMPDQYDSDGTPMYKGNLKVEFADVFKDWSIQVGKHIIISGPSIGDQPFSFERMPGEDQWAIFMLIAGETDTNAGTFRILD